METRQVPKEGGAWQLRCRGAWRQDAEHSEHDTSEPVLAVLLCNEHGRPCSFIGESVFLCGTT